MDPIDLTTRTEAGSALTLAQHDANLTAIQTAVNAIITKLALLAADDGTLVTDLISDVDAIADDVVTLVKFKALTDDKGKFLRANKTTGAIEAAQIVSASASDTTEVDSTAVQTGLEIGSVTIDDLPAGDVLVWASLMGKRNAGANGGTISLKNGATVLDEVATHGLDGAGTSWIQFSLFGKIENFAGGSLTLTWEFETAEASSDVTFGVDGEGRFGRNAKILAGL